MSGDQIPSLQGKKRRQMPRVGPEGDVKASIWLVHKFNLYKKKISKQIL